MTKIFPDFCSANSEEGAGSCSQSPPLSLQLKTVGFCDTCWIIRLDYPEYEAVL